MIKNEKEILRESLINLILPIVLFLIIGILLSSVRNSSQDHIPTNYDIFGTIGLGIAVVVFSFLVIAERTKILKNRQGVDAKREQQEPPGKFLIYLGSFWPVYNTAIFFAFYFLNKVILSPDGKRYLFGSFLALLIIQTIFMVLRFIYLSKYKFKDRR